MCVHTLTEHLKVGRELLQQNGDVGEVVALAVLVEVPVHVLAVGRSQRRKVALVRVCTARHISQSGNVCAYYVCLYCMCARLSAHACHIG